MYPTNIKASTLLCHKQVQFFVNNYNYNKNETKRKLLFIFFTVWNKSWGQILIVGLNFIIKIFTTEIMILIIPSCEFLEFLL